MSNTTLLGTLERAVEDFSSLEVATFTKSDDGAISVDLSAQDGATNAIFTSIRANLNQKELVGYIRFEADGDTVAFINNDDKFADVLEYHKEMIKAGQKTRKDLYDTIVGLIKG